MPFDRGNDPDYSPSLEPAFVHFEELELVKLPGVIFYAVRIHAVPRGEECVIDDIEIGDGATYYAAPDELAALIRADITANHMHKVEEDCALAALG